MMKNRNTRLLSFDSCKICLQVFLDFTLQKQNKTTVMNNHQLRKIFISVLLSVCSVIFAFGQNEKSLVDRILKNPEYQNQWSEIQQMRKENASEIVALVNVWYLAVGILYFIMNCLEKSLLPSS